MPAPKRARICSAATGSPTSKPSIPAMPEPTHTPGRLAPFGVIRGEPGVPLVGRVQGSDLPGKVVVTGPGGELVQAHGPTTERQFRPPRRSRRPGYLPSVGPYVNGSR